MAEAVENEKESLYRIEWGITQLLRENREAHYGQIAIGMVIGMILHSFLR